MKSAKSGQGVSVIIPAYNEEQRLPQTLERFLSAMERSTLDYEFIVVSDGNRDKTASVARTFSHRKVTVLEFNERLGKGGAVKAGVDAAKYDTVGFLDADGPISPEDLFKLIDALAYYDCVVASRWVAGAQQIVPQRRSRVVLSRGWNALVRSTFRLPLKDTQCGVKFFKRSLSLPVLRAVVITNWAFDVALLYHFRKRGHTICEVPVAWTDSSESHLKPWRDVPLMFLSLLAVRFINSPLGSQVPRPIVEWFTSVVSLT
jgi:glycosyltransferase involved in cell wall biosynthesis